MIGDATSEIIKIAIYLKYYLKTELIDFDFFIINCSKTLILIIDQKCLPHIHSILSLKACIISRTCFVRNSGKQQITNVWQHRNFSIIPIT